MIKKGLLKNSSRALGINLTVGHPDPSRVLGIGRDQYKRAIQPRGLGDYL